MIYLVVWSGGYEAPQYEVKGSESEAWDIARSWALDMDNDKGDWIDVLKIDPKMLSVERLESI